MKLRDATDEEVREFEKQFEDERTEEELQELLERIFGDQERINTRRIEFYPPTELRALISALTVLARVATWVLLLWGVALVFLMVTAVL